MSNQVCCSLGLRASVSCLLHDWSCDVVPLSLEHEEPPFPVLLSYTGYVVYMLFTRVVFCLFAISFSVLLLMSAFDGVLYVNLDISQ